MLRAELVPPVPHERLELEVDEFRIGGMRQVQQAESVIQSSDREWATGNAALASEACCRRWMVQLSLAAPPPRRSQGLTLRTTNG